MGCWDNIHSYLYYGLFVLFVISGRFFSDKEKNGEENNEEKREKVEKITEGESET